MKFRSLGIIIFGLTLAVAGCSASLRSRAVQSTQAAHVAVSASQDTEIQLYATKAVPNLTEADHKAFHASLVKYFDAESRVLIVLKAWKAGDPPPANLGEALGALGEASAVLRKVGPSALKTVLDYTDAAFKALQNVMALTSGGK